MHILLRIVGYCLILFSLTFLLVYAAMLFDPAEDGRRVIGGLMAMLVGILLGGVYLVRAGGRRSREKVEKQILQVAADKGGVLTAEELAMITRLDLGECKEHLEALCRQGACQLLVTDVGGMRYVFAGLLSADNAREHPLQSD